MSVIEEVTFPDEEPTDEELNEIAAQEEAGLFNDPDWYSDQDVDYSYPDADYDYDEEDPYDIEYDAP